MSAYWLAKSEPDVYSILDLARDKRTFWNGVRNYAARNFLREMRVGDLVLFYHSNARPSGVAGVARVVKEARPDPTQFDKKAGEDGGYDAKSTRDDPHWFGVDVEFVEAWDPVVPLATIKATPQLTNMKLLKVSRLSVTPVTSSEWKALARLRVG